MNWFRRFKDKCSGFFGIRPTVEEAEVSILGIKGKIVHKTFLKIPHEVSLFVPRLEITNKVTEGGKTVENTLVLNSLTIVSAPRRKESSRDLNIELDPHTQISFQNNSDGSP